MMTATTVPTLSICLTCRDGREGDRGDVRGGARLARAVCAANRQGWPMQLRGVRCMSQCKRSCVVSLTAAGSFTYIFGDIDPEDPMHLQAILDLIPLYCSTPEGFLNRNARPEPLRASILGRLPPIGTHSDLVTDLGVGAPAEAVP